MAHLRGVVVGLCSPARLAAQTRERDPMTEAEVDQMREAADYPNKRLELMVRFAKERVAMIGILRTDPPLRPRGPSRSTIICRTSSRCSTRPMTTSTCMLQHHADMRKGLKLLIEANSEWQLNLRQLKEQSPPDELQQYSFVLANAVDTVADSAKSARETLEEQNKLAAEKKLNKDYSERKD